MIKKYRSKPFEAFILAPDMSNWREACEFLGDDISQYEGEEYDNPPEFLDVNGYIQWYALPTDYIVKECDGDLRVYGKEQFESMFEEVSE